MSKYDGYTPARAAANKRYASQFVELRLRVTPERRDAIQAHCEKNGESVNAFLTRLVDEAMKE